MRDVFRRGRSEFARGLGFFDVIYGFAVTLLIVNVDMPPAELWSSPAQLMSGDLASHLTGFGISFTVIALFWYSNTALLGQFHSLDGPVIAANLVTACLVVLIPFTTQAISDPVISERPLATATYATNVGLAILSQSAMFELGRARGLTAHDAPRASWWATRLEAVARVAVFALSIPVAYLASPAWGQLSWLLLIPVGVIGGRWSARVETRASAPDPVGPGATEGPGAP